MNEFYTLNDGFAIPKLGLGTYKLNGFAGQRRIEMALSSGYRLIDSAVNYENEGTVGAAVRNSSVPREEITVTSKLPGRHHKYDQAIEVVQESLMRMNLDYIDLYLIHWPNPKEDLYVEAWQALIDMQKAGHIRSIGTSNFLPEHIDRLEKETGVLPVVNQIELHPYFNQEDQLEYHQEKQIQLQGWSPIGRGSSVAKEAVIQEIGAKYNKSAQQVIFRWHVERGVIPIPKSGNYARQIQNLAIFDFELSKDEVQAIDDLGSLDGRMADQNPAYYQEF